MIMFMERIKGKEFQELLSSDFNYLIDKKATSRAHLQRKLQILLIVKQE